MKCVLDEFIQPENIFENMIIDLIRSFEILKLKICIELNITADCIFFVLSISYQYIFNHSNASCDSLFAFYCRFLMY